ncbi:MAG: hypothetical protein N3D11_11650 [Candidatus Sumerlaeia bacterium]|nr:hypothetical protein [Candidatus Sumerlaeia bacterium]
MSGTPSDLVQYDEQLHWRCRMLGGEVPFRYCRTLNEGLPCRHVIGCWKTVFDVETFLDAHYARETLAAVWDRPRPDKMVQLAELVERARQTQQAAKASEAEISGEGKDKG